MGTSSTANKQHPPTSGINGYGCVIHPCSCRGASQIQRKSRLFHAPPFCSNEASGDALPMGSMTFLAPSSTTITVLEDDLVLKGGGDVMGGQQTARADGLIVQPSYLYKFNYLWICNLY